VPAPGLQLVIPMQCVRAPLCHMLPPHQPAWDGIWCTSLLCVAGWWQLIILLAAQVVASLLLAYLNAKVVSLDATKPVIGSLHVNMVDEEDESSGARLLPKAT
jgi:hypothetical protein